MDKKTVAYTENRKYRCLEDHQWVNTMSIISPLNLDYCGMEQCEPEQRFGPYVRENYVVHIILDGCGTLRVGEQSYQISQGGGIFDLPWTGDGLSGGSGTSMAVYVDRISRLYGKESGLFHGAYGRMPGDMRSEAGLITG